MGLLGFAYSGFFGQSLSLSQAQGVLACSESSPEVEALVVINRASLGWVLVITCGQLIHQVLQLPKVVVVEVPWSYLVLIA